MAKVTVNYSYHQFCNKKYITEWSYDDLERFLKEFKNATGGYNGDYFTVNCQTQDAYIIWTRFLMANKVL